jgi:hypothetical protein
MKIGLKQLNRTGRTVIILQQPRNLRPQQPVLQSLMVTSATIAGPANLVLDPAAVGDNTGIVRIKGDLYVDGTHTIINSTIMTIADLNISIANAATTDSLADGAGFTVDGPDNTFLYEYNGGTNPWH